MALLPHPFPSPCVLQTTWAKRMSPECRSEADSFGSDGWRTDGCQGQREPGIYHVQGIRHNGPRSLMALMSKGFRFDRARSGLHRRYLSCGHGNGLALFIAKDRFFLAVECLRAVIWFNAMDWLPWLRFWLNGLFSIFFQIKIRCVVVFCGKICTYELRNA